MSNAAQVHYKPSPVVLTGKAVLGAIRRVMPGGLYKRFYSGVDRTYRSAIRYGYGRHLLSAKIRGSAAEAERARAVFTVMPYSLVGWSGLEATYDVIVAVNREKVSGAIVECGVAQGGCASLMALTDRRLEGNRPIWLCDSYEGLPDPTADDYQDGATGRHVSQLVRGSCLGTIDQVSELLFDTFKLDPSRITLVKGWFQDTLPGHRASMNPIAVLRIDADWFESVKCCLDNLFDLVVPGGFVIIDDYGSCFGAQKAVDGFLASRGIAVPLVHDLRGGCYFRKPV